MPVAAAVYGVGTCTEIVLNLVSLCRSGLADGAGLQPPAIALISAATRTDGVIVGLKGFNQAGDQIGPAGPGHFPHE
jgi:hypothetical protein